MIERILIAAVTALLSVNIWTGAPLLALWVGSHTLGEQGLNMAAVGLVLMVLATLDYGMAIALTQLNEHYDEITRAQRAGTSPGRTRALTALEAIVVTNVYAAFIALSAWYLLFSGRPFSLVL